MYKFLFGLLLIFSSCNNTQKTKPQPKILFDVDSNLSHDTAFTILDKQFEGGGAYNLDTLIKKTNGVNYCVQYTNWDTIVCPSNYSCNAIIVNSDTLKIYFGGGDGFGSQGFYIQYNNGTFKFRPYKYTDECFPTGFEESSLFVVVDQELKLSKIKYKEGDSLHGKIHFNIIENAYGHAIRHSGNGYFRTKVHRGD